MAHTLRVSHHTVGLMNFISVIIGKIPYQNNGTFHVSYGVGSFFITEEQLILISPLVEMYDSGITTFTCRAVFDSGRQRVDH